MSIKVTPRGKKNDRETVSVKTMPKSAGSQSFEWWNAESKAARATQLLETVIFLKEQQSYRNRQAGIWARMYGNLPLMNWYGSTLGRMSIGQNLPNDRPTMNVVQSCVDTLVSRVTQARPRPVFLTDNGDYKERNLAKQLNQFVMGEFFRCKAYELGPLILRDAEVLGTGCLKKFETQDHKVGLERTLLTELLVDPNDAMYGNPRQLYQMKLVDRSVLAADFPDVRSKIASAENAYPDNSADAQKTVADQVMICEGWHLPSSPDANDGRHTIACSSGIIFDEEYTKPTFPFIFLHYSPRLLGFWGQGLSEQLMGTQIEINKLLATISASINIVGVPRVFIEDGSKVVKAHLNNQIGSLITYRGTKPSYEVAPCVPQEMYAQLQRLIEYAYSQSGVSALSATSQKPAGLNSGEAIRNYDDLQSDRFASLVKRYDNMFVDLAYQVIDLAKDIAERDGKYETVYPGKDGTRKVDLPAAKILDNTFIIQCFDASSLPRDPAGRLEKVTEMAQAGMISLPEARRLLDYPDLQQNDKLENASEERILQILDEIVDKGKYTPADSFMDLQLATKLCNQYYNLYVPAKLDEKKAQMLRDFAVSVQTLITQAQTPAMPAPGASPIAVPEAPQQSPLLPNAPI